MCGIDVEESAISLRMNEIDSCRRMVQDIGILEAVCWKSHLCLSYLKVKLDSLVCNI